jgi:hypothetical protein
MYIERSRIGASDTLWKGIGADGGIGLTSARLNKENIVLN